MPLIDLNKIIAEYYEKIKDDYPPMSLEKFSKLCKAPFWFFNKQMSRPEMPTVLIKHIGKLVVLSTRIETLLRKNKLRYICNRIKEPEYKERKIFLLALLEKVKKQEDGQQMEFINREDDTEECESISTGEL